MNALTIQNLRKTYQNGFEALKGIDLEVKQGDFFALLGANGAGKSTAIGIISSLVNPTSGNIKIFNYDLKTQRNLAKSCLGVVPQEINFNQFDTAKNIVLNQAGYYGIPKKTALQRVETCLKQVDLWDKRDTVSRRLSGGMKRRVMIARAMVHNPKLLILDEPTAGVDIEIRRSMWEMMKEVNAQGTTIILTTHYLEEAESLCRNIAIIDSGKIIEHSDMASLLTRLHVDYFILDLAQPLKNLALEGFEVTQISEKVIEIGVPKERNLNELFEKLSAANIQVVSMKNKSNRLEQLFINLIDNKNEKKS